MTDASTLVCAVTQVDTVSQTPYRRCLSTGICRNTGRSEVTSQKVSGLNLQSIGYLFLVLRSGIRTLWIHKR